MSLGEMVNLARGVQDYKSGTIALTLEQQKERERNAMQEFLAKPENFQTNGRIDIDKLNAAVPSLAPLTGSEYINRFTTLGNAQTQAIQAKQNLTQDQRSMIGQRFAILGRLGVQDKNAYIAEMDLLKKENPDNPDLHKLIDAYKVTWNEIPSGPQLPSMAIAGANTLLKPETQQQLFAPQAGTISTNAATFQTTTRPSVAGEVPVTTVAQQPLAVAQLPPGSRVQPTGRMDINNREILNIIDANGRYAGTISAGDLPPGAALPGQEQLTPTGAMPVAPRPGMQQPGMQQPTMQQPAPQPTTGMVPTARMRPGQTAQTYASANEAIIASANAALQVPNQTFNNNQIIKIADDVATGKGAASLGNLTGGYAFLPWTSDNATNLNMLGDYMAKQQVSLAQTAGIAGSDAGRALAAETVGSTGWTADAIKHTARINRALSTATDLFNQGVQNAFGKSNDPISYRDFQNKWSTTVDINAIRLYDAIRNNDKEAIQEVVKAAGGRDSAGYKRLVDNIGRMQQLIRGQ